MARRPAAALVAVLALGVQAAGCADTRGDSSFCAAVRRADAGFDTAASNAARVAALAAMTRAAPGPVRGDFAVLYAVFDAAEHPQRYDAATQRRNLLALAAAAPRIDRALAAQCDVHLPGTVRLQVGFGTGGS